jgi:hypothetical protein
MADSKYKRLKRLKSQLYISDNSDIEEIIDTEAYASPELNQGQRQRHALTHTTHATRRRERVDYNENKRVPLYHVVPATQTPPQSQSKSQPQSQPQTQSHSQLQKTLRIPSSSASTPAFASASLSRTATPSATPTATATATATPTPTPEGDEIPTLSTDFVDFAYMKRVVQLDLGKKLSVLGRVSNHTAPASGAVRGGTALTPSTATDTTVGTDTSTTRAMATATATVSDDADVDADVDIDDDEDYEHELGDDTFQEDGEEVVEEVTSSTFSATPAPAPAPAPALVPVPVSDHHHHHLHQPEHLEFTEAVDAEIKAKYNMFSSAVVEARQKRIAATISDIDREISTISAKHVQFQQHIANLRRSVIGEVMLETEVEAEAEGDVNDEPATRGRGRSSKRRKSDNHDTSVELNKMVKPLHLKPAFYPAVFEPHFQQTNETILQEGKKMQHVLDNLKLKRDVNTNIMRTEHSTAFIENRREMETYLRERLRLLDEEMGQRFLARDKQSNSALDRLADVASNREWRDTEEKVKAVQKHLAEEGGV